MRRPPPQTTWRAASIQIYQVSQQAAEGGQQTNQSAFELASRVEQLQSLVSRFKVHEGADAETVAAAGA